MGKPAARLTDMHVCPMATPGTPPIPHVGGPIIGPGCPTVLIGGLPAAVVGDMCICVGPPDSIVMGSTGVFIGKKPAVRMGDQCAHGGTIMSGLPTVLIGEVSGANVGTEEAAMAANPRASANDGQWDESPAALSNSRKENDLPPIVEKSSIAFKLTDQDGNVIAGENYEVTLPDGSVRKGTTDNQGEVTISGIDPGMCQVSFPDIHGDEWA